MPASGQQPLDSERRAPSTSAAIVTRPSTRAGTGSPSPNHCATPAAKRLREGVAPAEVAWIEARFRETGSPYSQDLRAKLEAALPGSSASGGELGLFPACTALAHHPDEITDAVYAMSRAGVDLPVALSTPMCCGYPLDTAGHEEAFAAHAHKVSVSLSGWKRLVTLGPPAPTPSPFVTERWGRRSVSRPRRSSTCSPSIRTAGGRWHRPTPKAGATPTATRASSAAAWGAFDEPRSVLRAALGEELVELGYSRGSALCSGGGGVYPLTHPAPARGCAGRVGRAVPAIRRPRPGHRLPLGAPPNRPGGSRPRSRRCGRGACRAPARLRT